MVVLFGLDVPVFKVVGVFGHYEDLLPDYLVYVSSG